MVNITLVNNFFDLCEKLDDDYILVCNFIMSHGKTKLKRAKVKYAVENFHYKKIGNEVKECLKMGDEYFDEFIKCYNSKKGCVYGSTEKR